MENEDLFKSSFKYYKSKKPKPKLNSIIDFDKNSKQFQELESITVDHLKLKNLFINTEKLRFYFVVSNPGLIFIRNPFTSIGQRYWIRRCLESYPNKPNKSNLDKDVFIENWWRHCHSDENGNELLNRLRWVTLGYHHDWNTKVYTNENYSHFPSELYELCTCIAKCIGHVDYKAQAAIVNYYHMDSTLSSHTDHSEVNLDAPLISISFGQSAIFLVGGQDKSIDPTPILLQSGDIVIMSKEARLCYHAVPKILPACSQPWKLEKEVSEEFKELNNHNWYLFNEYISLNRINLNIRQVLYNDQTSLYER